jgi:hypothetical protein
LQNLIVSIVFLRSPSPKSTPITEVIPPEKTVEDQKQIVVLVDDILNLPGRNVRPPKIVIILRGPPGSGKTYVAKLIKVYTYLKCSVKKIH